MKERGISTCVPNARTCILTAVFPASQALVVMPAAVPAAHAVRVADEETPHPLFDTEVDHLPRGLMAQVAHAPLTPPAHPVLRALQLLPPTRVFLAATLLPGELTQLFRSLTLERADAAPSHDQGCSCVRGGSRQVDFSQVNGRLDRTRSRFYLWDFEADVQFKAVMPNEGTRASIGGKIEGRQGYFIRISGCSLRSVRVVSMVPRKARKIAWTVWLYNAKRFLVACCIFPCAGHRVWARRACLCSSIHRFQTCAASICASLRRRKSDAEGCN